MKFILDRLLGTLIRHGLTALGLWLSAHGVGAMTTDTQNNITELILGSIVVLGSLAWSSIRTHLHLKDLQDISRMSMMLFSPQQQQKIDVEHMTGVPFKGKDL